MITSYFSQKNICAFLGLLMAVTIVWMAKADQTLSKKTAQVEISNPIHSSTVSLEISSLNKIEGESMYSEFQVL